MVWIFCHLVGRYGVGMVHLPFADLELRLERTGLGDDCRSLWIQPED